MRISLRPLAALLVLVATVAARAETSEQVEIAKGHFQTGSVYFEQGDYAKALHEFLAARAVSNRPEFDFNIGRTYEQMGDAARAIVYYQKYLAARPDAEDAAETRRTVERLRYRVGALRIVVTVPETRLTLDGEPVPPEQAERIEVTAGPHVVVASREGYLSRSANVKAVPGETVTVSIDPQLPAAAASVPAAPPEPARPARWKLGLAIGLPAAVLVAGAVALGLAFGLPSMDYWRQGQEACAAPCQVVDFR